MEKNIYKKERKNIWQISKKNHEIERNIDEKNECGAWKWKVAVNIEKQRKQKISNLPDLDDRRRNNWIEFNSWRRNKKVPSFFPRRIILSLDFRVFKVCWLTLFATI